MKKELAEKESQLSVKPVEKAADDELSWLNILSHETSENVQERINLQKASFELEETNCRNRTELQQLDDAIAKQQVRRNNVTILINFIPQFLHLVSFSPWDAAHKILGLYSHKKQNLLGRLNCKITIFPSLPLGLKDCGFVRKMREKQKTNAGFF